MPFNANLATKVWLNAQGWLVDVVERSNQYIKRDFLGFADLAGLKPAEEYQSHQHQRAVAVQTTTGSNASSRRKKMRLTPGFHAWKTRGGEVYLVTWSKKALKRGGRKVWTPRLEYM